MNPQYFYQKARLETDAMHKLNRQIWRLKTRLQSAVYLSTQTLWFTKTLPSMGVAYPRIPASWEYLS
jgi:hypothetical protein